MHQVKRFTVVATTALAATFAFAPAVANAAPIPPAPGPSGMASMPGMDMSPAPANKTGKADLSAGVQRSRQRAQFFIADLKGTEEVPRGSGDLNGGGTGVLRIQGNRVTFAFTWHGINAPTLGHIHQEVRGKNGAVVQPLFTTPMPDTADAAAGVVAFDSAKTADDIRSDPSKFYLNLHTKDHDKGAIRGQLRRLSRPLDVVGAVLHGGPLKAFLSGREEVPADAGDYDAKAVAFVDAHGTRVDYSFAWVGLHPTMGHIHEERRGKNGPIAVPLFTTAVPDTIVAVSGTVAHVDPHTVGDIKRDPKGFYANLHSAQHPDGAARGQLYKR
jgi:hypothetical protein